MRNAPNLVLVGPMGAGKSSIGRRLAERFDATFVDLDRAIEARTGARVATIFDCEGEAGFRTREREVLGGLLAGDRQVVATGGGSVLLEANRVAMRSRACVVWLQVPLPEQLQRLARDRDRPLLATGDREATLKRLSAERDPLYADVADLAFDTAGLDPCRATDLLASALADRWPAGAAA
jgi:shikimate kinase